MILSFMALYPCCLVRMAVASLVADGNRPGQERMRVIPGGQYRAYIIAVAVSSRP